jgi:Mg2+ and Co2+ transporter CorA
MDNQEFDLGPHPGRGFRRLSGTFHDDEDRILMREHQFKFQGPRRASIAGSTVPQSVDPSWSWGQLGYAWPLSRNTARIEEPLLIRIVLDKLQKYSLFEAARHRTFLFYIVQVIVHNAIEAVASGEDEFDWWIRVRDETEEQLEFLINHFGMHTDVFDDTDDLADFAYTQLELCNRCSVKRKPKNLRH